MIENKKDSPFNTVGIILSDVNLNPIIQYGLYPELAYVSGLSDYRNFVEMNQLLTKCYDGINFIKLL
jgi:hypothetical protein